MIEGECHMYCVYCGHEVKEGNKFCGNCGAPITPEPHPPLNSAPPVNMSGQQFQGDNRIPNTKKRMSGGKWALIVLGAILCVFLVIIAVIAISATHNEKVFQEQKEALMQEFYSRFTFPENEESETMTQAIQGEWILYNEDGQVDDTFTFEDDDEYMYYSSGSIMTGSFSIFGEYAIDTESNTIYLISDGAEKKFDELKREDSMDVNDYIDMYVHEIVYDYDEVAGRFALYYNGERLSR